MKTRLTKIVLPALIGLVVLSGCERRTPETGETTGGSGTGNPAVTGGSGATPGTEAGAAPGSAATSGSGTESGTGTGATPGSSGTATGGAGGGEATGSDTGNSGAGSGGMGGQGGSTGGSTGGSGSGNPGTTGMGGSASGNSAGSSAGAAVVSAADRHFMDTAAQLGQAEIEASRLAAERGSAQAVKAFADTMVRDHTTMAQQLSDLASRKGVTLPTGLRARDSADLTRLRAARGSQFDRLYTERIGVADHKDAVNLFEQAARTATDPDVKAFAAAGAPTLRSHLTMAQNLGNPAGSGAMGGSGAGNEPATPTPAPRQNRG